MRAFILMGTSLQSLKFTNSCVFQREISCAKEYKVNFINLSRTRKYVQVSKKHWFATRYCSSRAKEYNKNFAKLFTNLQKCSSVEGTLVHNALLFLVSERIQKKHCYRDLNVKEIQKKPHHRDLGAKE